MRTLSLLILAASTLSLPALSLPALADTPSVHPSDAAALSSTASSSTAQEPQVLPGATSAEAGAPAHLEAIIAVPPGYKVYKDMVAVEVLDAGGLELGEPSLPAGLVKVDPAAPGNTREQYEFDAILELPVQGSPGPGQYQATLSVRFQACKASLCLFPKTQEVVSSLQVGAAP